MITEHGGESSASGVFVGRAHALAELDVALDTAAAGRAASPS
jgi:hypothetical protein